MKKLFISQPMDGLSNSEILKARNVAVREAESILGEGVVLIDSFITDPPQDCVPLWYLGRSILLLAKADIAYFGKGWRESRGCVIENMCAVQYGLLTIESN